MKSNKIKLKIRHNERQYWGYFSFGEYGNEVSADSIEDIVLLGKKELERYCNLTNVNFEHIYDITGVFEEFEFINVTALARYIDVNPGLLRQYAAGSKHPSKNQLKKIVDGFYGIARQMNRIALAFDGKPLLD